MDEQILQQLFAELIDSIEPLETQHAALLQLLKSKGIVKDEDLAPFLEQAGNSSNIRWRAVQLRTAALISSALRPSSKSREPNTSATDAEPSDRPGKDQAQSADRKQHSKEESGPPGKSQAQQGGDENREARVDNHDSNEDQRPDKRSDDNEQPTEEDLRESKLSNPPLIQKSKEKESDNDRESESEKDKDRDRDKDGVKSSDSISPASRSAAKKPESEAA